MRDSGELDADETFIPVRVIDKNIEREIPPYMNFLTQPARIGVFKDQSDPSANCEALDTDFTTAIKYPGWILPFFRSVDAAESHGYTAIESCFDTTNPGCVAHHDIGTENLILPHDAISIQACPYIGIRLEVSSSQLDMLVKKNQFNAKVVQSLITKKSEPKRDSELFEIYKFFIKVEGVVWVGWYTPEVTDDWLKDFVLFDNGVRTKVTTTENVPTGEMDMMGQPVMAPVPKESWEPVEETEYPIFLYIYKLTEDKRIILNEGRAILDASKQDAQTSLWSSFVNGVSRATNVYGSPANQVEPGLNLEILDVKIENGRIYNQKVDFWSQPYPPVDIVRAVQALDTSTQDELGQVSYAANNRVDSRKTATEVAAAEKQNQLLDTVTVVLFSNFIQSILNYDWRIVQSQALQNNIPFCQIEVPSGPPDPVTGQIQMIKKNDVDRIARKYVIYAAGDSDVVQKEQRLQRRKEFWPFVENFPPLAVAFLIDMLKDAFPQDGAKYEKILQQSAGGDFRQLAQGLYSMLTALIQSNPAVAQDPNIQKNMPQIQAIGQQLATNSQGQPQPASK